MTYPIPDAALDDRLGWIGTSGSGKTYNASSGVESLLETGARVIIVDPLDVWWGLRLSADGKPSKFTLPIFGGEHGDLPLNARAGKLIGETVATMGESCIVSLSAFGTKEDERHFMLDFLEALYRKSNGETFHVVFDEADLWAPQGAGTGSGPKLQSLMEQIVRRGRVKGFIPWLITQRSAVISKDVLSQVDGLVIFKLTSSNDRKAIGEWVKSQADMEIWNRIWDSFPAMQQGQGVVWIPARGILETVQFPLKTTFNSSKAPERGKRTEHRDLKPLNLEALKGKLAGLEQEQKANDPRALKAEIARLGRELVAEKKRTTVDLKVNARPAIEEVSEIRGQLKALEQRAIAAETKLAKIGKIIGDPRPSMMTIEGARARRSSPPVVEQRPRTDPVHIRAKAAPIEADGSVPPGCAKPLAALAGVYPAGMTEPQWATSAGYKRSGGTWGTYKSRLRGAGLIESREGKWFATQAGAEAVGEVEMPPAPGPDLVRWWTAKLPGTSRMAEALIEAWPNGLSKDELAARLDMSASGGSFGTYLSRLASPGLITRGAEIRLADEVMGG